MLVSELTLHLLRVFYFTVTILSVVDYLRYRDRIRRDIALVFISLSSTTFVLFFVTITGLQIPWLSKIGQVGIASLPILLLRMVGYFRPVPGEIKRVALVGWAASAVGILLFDASRVGGVMLLVIIYFVGVSGYSVLAFIRAGLGSTGIARRRLRFAALASALLVTLIIPGFAAVLGWAVLGEALGWPHALGMALIALGFAVMDGRLLRRRA